MKNRRLILLAVAACLAIVMVRALVGRGRQVTPPRNRIRLTTRAQVSNVRCLRVIDGDTLVISGDRRVRVIGIDTPERGQPGFQEATIFARQQVEGRPVRLEVCPVKPTDRYGRIRGVVFYADADSREHNLAIELLRQGYANVYTLPPCHLDTEAWLKYAREAREHNRGLWSEIGEVPTSHGGTTVLEPR